MSGMNTCAHGEVVTSEFQVPFVNQKPARHDQSATTVTSTIRLMAGKTETNNCRLVHDGVSCLIYVPRVVQRTMYVARTRKHAQKFNIRYGRRTERNTKVRSVRTNDGKTNEQTNGQTTERTNGRKDERTKGRTNRAENRNTGYVKKGNNTGF